MEILRLADIRAQLHKIFGRDISEAKLRRYDKDKIIKLDREESSKFRTCTQEALDEIVNTISLIETGLALGVLKNKDIEAVKSHIVAVKKIAPKLRLPKDWN